MISFLVELVNRLFGKTPQFFKIIQIVSVIVALITGLPEFLSSSGIELPAAWQAVSSKVVSIAALISTFIAQLTVTSSEKKDNPEIKKD